MKHCQFTSAAHIASFVVCAALATTAPVRGENLALGQPCKLAPEPNYRHCTDAADTSQLTDGARTLADAQLWVQKGAVGWTLPLDGHAEAVIDLGRVQAIDAVSVSTGANPQAEVYLPSVIVAVSDDGQDFRRAGGLVLTPEAEQLARTVLVVRALRIRGRYVVVRLVANGVFAFCDEIEILSGDHALSATELPAEQFQPLQVQPHRSSLQKRLAGDLDRLGKRLSELGGNRGQVLDRLAVIRQRVDETDTVDDATVQLLEGQVRALQRDLAPMLYRTPELAVWRVSPWADISPGDLPDVGAPLAELHVVAGQSEYESAAFMLTNLCPNPLTIRITLDEQMQTQAQAQWQGHIKLRRVLFVRTRDGGYPADALPLLGDRPVSLPPWETRQVWIEVFTGSSKPGTYPLPLALTDGAQFRHEIELTVEVLPVGLPEDLPLATYSWHYVDTWPALRGIEAIAVADLAAHYTNMNIFTNRLLPWPEQIDADGNIIGTLDFSGYDALLDLCRPISTKGTAWFLNMRGGRGALKEIEQFSPAWNRAFSAWLKQFMAHLAERGLGYSDVLLYPFDEYARSDFVKIGRVLRAADPKLRIFANPMLRDSADILRQAAPYVDIWCPLLSGVTQRPEQMRFLHNTGATVWSYTVCHGRHSHAYAEFRLALWRAFKHGAKGCGFWCYAQGGSWRDDLLWDDFSARYSDYAVIYTLKGAPPDISRTEPIIPSKRWEAWREGIEDYVWLHMLRAAGSPEGHSLVAEALRETLDHTADATRADRYSRACLRGLAESR